MQEKPRKKNHARKTTQEKPSKKNHARITMARLAERDHRGTRVQTTERDS